MGIDERGSTAGGGGAVVAYFSMEVGLEPDMPTYAGGLGILAGDTLRAAADLCLPVVGVTLVHRQGYFRQELSDDGWQSEHPVPWAPERRLEPVGVRVEIPLEGRPVHIRAWRHTVRGATGHTVALLLLDTDLPENAEEHRGLTDHLYGGDARYRLCQEAVLGLGGVAMLRALGWRDVAVYHMNEGHSALLALALLEELEAARAGDGPPDREALEAVRRRCVFTTHTPVAAGHDRFPMDLVRHVLGQERAVRLERAGCAAGGELDMTRTALRLSGFVNGVAMRHREVTRKMFPEHRIGAITNGVHAVTWTSPAMRAVFDRHIPEWRVQNGNLRYAVEIPLEEIVEAHRASRIRLLEEIERRIGRRLDPDALTIGFARRAAPYKRVTLAFTDPERLRALSRDAGRLQFVLAGKAHPGDGVGRELIHRVHEAARALGEDLPVVYLEDYDMRLGALLTAGVDLWLNTPRQPLEASGTSGMKAALNGVPSLSILDGWWIEGHVEGVTGWAIGEAWSGGDPDDGADAAAFYEKLESAVIPTFYSRPDAYAHMRRWAIALNGSFFNAERMLLQYAVHAYRLPELAFRRPGADVVEVSEAEALAAGQGEGAEGAPVEASPVAPAEDRSAA